MGKFLEISTMREALHPRAYSINETVDSAKITSSFVKTANEELPMCLKNQLFNLENYYNVQI
jgi:hypothetical protein